jgi:hypothetical protein
MPWRDGQYEIHTARPPPQNQKHYIIASTAEAEQSIDIAQTLRPIAIRGKRRQGLTQMVVGSQAVVGADASYTATNHPSRRHRKQGGAPEAGNPPFRYGISCNIQRTKSCL